MKTSMQTSSLLKGSTARKRVSSVVSARRFPQGIIDEKANGPAGMGQNASAELGSLKIGSGEGGRMSEQRYELFVHAFNVRTEVDVNKVASKDPG